MDDELDQLLADRGIGFSDPDPVLHALAGFDREKRKIELDNYYEFIRLALAHDETRAAGERVAMSLETAECEAAELASEIRLARYRALHQGES